MLCSYCTIICQDALVETDSLDSQGRQSREIQHFEGHTLKELQDGVKRNCYLCKRFWDNASEKYKTAVQNGQLYPPRNTQATVTSFSISILPDLNRVRDPSEHRRIFLSLYYSEVEYRTYFMPHIHAKDCQLFVILLPSGLRSLQRSQNLLLANLGTRC